MRYFTFLFVIGALAVFSCKKEKEETDSVPAEIKVGSQTWMSKNLDINTFRNGETIPEAKNSLEWELAGKNKKPVWCYYENLSSNNGKLGKLYNWYAVSDPRGLAPEGWHIPSKAEYSELIENLGGQSSAGVKLKSKSDWKDGGNGTNESLFNGYPSGIRSSSGLFANNGVYGYWWSTSEQLQTHVWFLFLSFSGNGAAFLSTTKEDGLPVRCIKD